MWPIRSRANTMPRRERRDHHRDRMRRADGGRVARFGAGQPAAIRGMAEIRVIYMPPPRVLKRLRTRQVTIESGRAAKAQGRSVLRSVTCDLGFPRAEMSESIRDNPNRRL